MNMSAIHNNVHGGVTVVFSNFCVCLQRFADFVVLVQFMLGSECSTWFQVKKWEGYNFFREQNNSHKH
jgi:hypothetical protein